MKKYIMLTLLTGTVMLPYSVQGIVQEVVTNAKEKPKTEPKTPKEKPPVVKSRKKVVTLQPNKKNLSRKRVVKKTAEEEEPTPGKKNNGRCAVM